MREIPDQILKALKSNDIDMLAKLELSSKKHYGDSGQTLLHLAAKYTDSLPIIKLLISKLKLSPRSLCTTKKTTPFHCACKRGYLPIVRYLVENCKVNVQSTKRGKMSPLLIAAKHGRTDVVIYLISKGADLMHCDGRGRNIAHWASKTGNLTVLWYLYTMGFPMNGTTHDHELPIHFAAQSGNTAAISFLYSIGQNLYSYDAKERNIIEHSRDWNTCEWILTHTHWLLFADRAISSLFRMKAPLELLLKYFSDSLKCIHAIVFDRADVLEYLLRGNKVKISDLEDWILGPNLSRFHDVISQWYSKRGLIYIHGYFTEHDHDKHHISRLPKTLIRVISDYI
jgi:hypothetical protein